MSTERYHKKLLAEIDQRQRAIDEVDRLRKRLRDAYVDPDAAWEQEREAAAARAGKAAIESGALTEALRRSQVARAERWYRDPREAPGADELTKAEIRTAMRNLAAADPTVLDRPAGPPAEND